MRFQVHLLTAIAAIAIVAACSERPQPSDSRGATGKADSFGTCEDYCGGPSDGSCWCDELCAEYGDCCQDISQHCALDACTPGDDSTCPDGFRCQAGQCFCPGGGDDCCTKAQCVAVPPSCDAQLANGEGLCELFFGWKWDGSSCQPVSGCACEGADCSALDTSAESCAAAHDACEPPAKSCGGFAGFMCDDDDWCDYGDATNCGFADQMGICRPIPDVCPAVVDPVCGCDGNVYSNACRAALVGVTATLPPDDPRCNPTTGEQCGNAVCAPGTECCNPLNGTCVMPGMACAF